jgi:hypothetical protein
VKFDTLLDFLQGAYPVGAAWPKPFHLLEGRLRVEHDEPLPLVAAQVGTSQQRLREIVSATDPVYAVLGVRKDDLSETDVRRTRDRIAQVLIGRAAEIAFESIYREELGPDTEFALEDRREDRNDTDYRVVNGRGRRLYRVNIKFFGAQFRRGPEMVGLDPEDCFPLATYKIFGALQKQQLEHLPYIFVVVTVPNLTAASIISLLPERDVEILALFRKSRRIERKREIEDRVIGRIVEAGSPAFLQIYEKIGTAEWYVISARRADSLLRELLFKRVYALRIPGFVHQFGGAEIDMHFSLKEDLVPLRSFLRQVRDETPAMVASLLERGTI